MWAAFGRPAGAYATGSWTRDERGTTCPKPGSLDLTGPSDETAMRRLRKRAVVASGIGFFTDAYDLFVIGIVSTLLKGQWHLGTGQLALLNAVMLGAAFLGAHVLRQARRLARPHPGVLDIRRADGARRDRLGAVTVAARADHLPLPARLRRRRRLPGHQRARQRVRAPRHPRQAGRPRLLRPGGRADRRPAARPRLPRQRRRRPAHLAAAARPRRHPRGRRGLAAAQAARVGPLHRRRRYQGGRHREDGAPPRPRGARSSRGPRPACAGSLPAAAC